MRHSVQYKVMGQVSDDPAFYLTPAKRCPRLRLGKTRTDGPEAGRLNRLIAHLWPVGPGISVTLGPVSHCLSHPGTPTGDK